MLYEQSMALARASFERWSLSEVFSFGWFLTLGILIVVYAIWLKVLDKQRTVPLLLIGTLAAFSYMVKLMLLVPMLGLLSYSIRLLPVPTPLLMEGVTLSPIIIMLAEQYSSSWKGFLLRSGIGFAILNFVIIVLFNHVGILQFHHWNVFYNFLIQFALSIFVRMVFLWISGIQQRHTSV